MSEEVDQAISWMKEYGRQQRTELTAFIDRLRAERAALLAVAKAMDATSINDDGYTDGLGRVDEAMDALSATHPTWREWQP